LASKVQLVVSQFVSGQKNNYTFELAILFSRLSFAVKNVRSEALLMAISQEVTHHDVIAVAAQFDRMKVTVSSSNRKESDEESTFTDL